MPISVDGTELRNGCSGNTPHVKRARMCESFSFLVPVVTEPPAHSEASIVNIKLITRCNGQCPSFQGIARNTYFMLILRDRSH